MSPGLLRILLVKSVLDGILTHLSPKQFIGLGRLCRIAYDVVSRYLETAFDIDKCLERFFSDPHSFRRMQALTSTLISGSFALLYFSRASYAGSILELYAHPHHRRRVGRWIIDAGYSFSPFVGQDGAFERAILRRNLPETVACSMPAVANVLTFRKNQADGKSSPLEVQLVVARRAPIEVILGFQSSEHPLWSFYALLTGSDASAACLINVITYEKAYSLFPLATVEPHLPSPGSSPTGALPLILKTPTILGPRWLGDPDTWVIHLDTTDILHPPPENPYSTAIAHDPATISSFSVRYHAAEDGAIITFSVVESSTLKYAYVFGDENLVDHVNRILAFKETESWRDIQAGLDSIV